MHVKQLLQLSFSWQVVEKQKQSTSSRGREMAPARPVRVRDACREQLGFSSSNPSCGLLASVWSVSTTFIPFLSFTPIFSFPFTSKSLLQGCSGKPNTAPCPSSVLSFCSFLLLHLLPAVLGAPLCAQLEFSFLFGLSWVTS